jgi:transposase-like protein
MARRTFTSEFKAKVALAAIRNNKTISELASEYQIHPILIAKWRRVAIEELVSLFEDGRKKRNCIGIAAQCEALGLARSSFRQNLFL